MVSSVWLYVTLWRASAFSVIVVVDGDMMGREQGARRREENRGGQGNGGGAWCQTVTALGSVDSPRLHIAAKFGRHNNRGCSSVGRASA